MEAGENWEMTNNYSPNPENDMGVHTVRETLCNACSPHREGIYDLWAGDGNVFDYVKLEEYQDVTLAAESCYPDEDKPPCCDNRVTHHHDAVAVYVVEYEGTRIAYLGPVVDVLEALVSLLEGPWYWISNRYPDSWFFDSLTDRMERDN